MGGGGQGLEYLFGGGGGGQGGPNSQQAHDVVTTSMRHNDVASTSFRRHVPTRFLINQCQIITFLILKSDNIENSRIELKGIVLQVRSNQIKVTFIIILPFSTWYICHFFLFHIEIEGKCGWIIGGGGGQRVCCPPPFKLLEGGGCSPRPPSSYAYALRSRSVTECHNTALMKCNIALMKCRDILF